MGAAPDARGEWQVTHGWSRDFDDSGQVRNNSFTPIVNETRLFEPATYYGLEQPIPSSCGLGDLQDTPRG